MAVLSNNIDPNKIFIVNRSELEGRIDPSQYHVERRDAIQKLKSAHDLFKLKDVVKNVKVITTEIPDKAIYIGLENIISNTGEYIPTNEKQSISSAGVFKKGQILFPKLRPYLNKVHLAQFDGVCSTEFHIFESNKFLNEFLAIYLRSSLVLNQTKHLMTGNTLPRLQTEDINNLPVPDISIDQQKNIIKYYNSAFTIKQQKEAKATELLNSIDTYLLKELGITLPKKHNALDNRIFTAQFSEITGGRFDGYYNSKYFREAEIKLLQSKSNIVSLKEIITFIESGSRPAGGVSNIESGILSFGGEHVNDSCEIELKNPKYIPEGFHNKILRTQTELHDVILVKDGATTGKIGIIEKDEHVGQNINEHVFMIKSNEKINPFYLAYYLHSESAQIQITRGITGATVTGLTKDVVKNLYIPLPDIKKQNEIVAHIQAIRQQAKRLQEEATKGLEEAKREVEIQLLS